jgi:hypothetical protein
LIMAQRRAGRVRAIDAVLRQKGSEDDMGLCGCVRVDRADLDAFIESRKRRDRGRAS